MWVLPFWCLQDKEVLQKEAGVDTDHQTLGPIILVHFNSVKHKPRDRTPAWSGAPSAGNKIPSPYGTASGCRLSFYSLPCSFCWGCSGFLCPPPHTLIYSYSQTACFSLCPETFSLRYSHCPLPYFTQLSGQKAKLPPPQPPCSISSAAHPPQHLSHFTPAP